MAMPTVGHEMRLSMLITQGGRSVRRMLSARDAVLPAEDLPVPPRWRWLVGGRLRVGEVNGRLVLQFVTMPALVDASIQAVSLMRHAARRMGMRGLRI